MPVRRFLTFYIVATAIFVMFNGDRISSLITYLPLQSLFTNQPLSHTPENHGPQNGGNPGGNPVAPQISPIRVSTLTVQPLP